MLTIENRYHHFFHRWTPHTPLDVCLTSIPSSPEHFYTPFHAIIVVPFSSTAATRWHICSKVCWPWKSLPSLFPLMNTPTPLDQCLTSILSSLEHSHTPSHAIIVVPFSSTAATVWHICSKVCQPWKSVPSLFPLMNTPHTPWCLPHIHSFFARAFLHPISCYYCRTLLKHSRHRTAYL